MSTIESDYEALKIEHERVVSEYAAFKAEIGKTLEETHQWIERNEELIEKAKRLSEENTRRLNFNLAKTNALDSRLDEITSMIGKEPTTGEAFSFLFDLLWVKTRRFLWSWIG